MFARLNFKIYTVTLISLAFLFRLLFLNLSPSTRPHALKHSVPQHLSVLEKNTTTTEALIDQLSIQINTPVEVCESLDTEDNFTKAVAVIILSGFHSFFKHIALVPKWTKSFDSIKCDICPKKYLSISVLRV